MLAAQYSEAGEDFNNLKIVTVPKPEPVKGQVVVKVVAAAVNPIDVMVMKGWMVGAGWSLPLPMTVGYDFSGVVDAVHADDADGAFKPGDEVFAVNWGNHKHDENDMPVAGAFAQYILIPASKLSRKPAELSFELAAAVALVGTTAYQIVHDCAQLSAGQKVLIFGGSSAVGAIAVQLAKNVGAYVVTTCSTRNIDYVRPFGADRIIDYKQEKWEDISDVKGFDAVIDTINESDGLSKAVSSGTLKADGRYVSIANTSIGFDPAGHPPLQFAAFYALKNSPEHQDTLARMMVEGKLSVMIDSEFEFTDDGVRAIMQKIASGTSQGKNVLRITK